MIKSRFLPAAEAELLKEVAYYSNARQGTGIKFQKAVEAAVEKASLRPEGGVPTSKGARSRIVKGFPFSVVYRASDAKLLDVAVAHHRRLPDYWLGRME